MDYTVCGILQAKILEWVAFPFSRGSSQPRNRTRASCIAGGIFELPGKPLPICNLGIIIVSTSVEVRGWKEIFYMKSSASSCRNYVLNKWYLSLGMTTGLSGAVPEIMHNAGGTEQVPSKRHMSLLSLLTERLWRTGLSFPGPTGSGQAGVLPTACRLPASLSTSESSIWCPL